MRHPCKGHLASHSCTAQQIETSSGSNLGRIFIGAGKQTPRKQKCLRRTIQTSGGPQTVCSRYVHPPSWRPRLQSNLWSGSYPYHLNSDNGSKLVHLVLLSTLKDKEIFFLHYTLHSPDAGNSDIIQDKQGAWQLKMPKSIGLPETGRAFLLVCNS
eukprot:1160239-Pelagomonas_calceolata.AAC.1